jgi:hypothetical protein
MKTMKLTRMSRNVLRIGTALAALVVAATALAADA